MSDNWDKGLPSEGMKAKVNKKRQLSFFACTAETRSTIKVPILYFAYDPESESEQGHNDSAPLVRGTVREQK